MKKRIFSLFFAAVFLMTAVAGIVPAAAEEENWTKSVTAIDGAEMMLTSEGVALTGSLTAVSVPDGNPGEGLLWKVTQKSKGYTFQSLATEQYLNLTKDGLALADKVQYLTVTEGNGGSLISSGSYYLDVVDSRWTVTTNKEIAAIVVFHTDSIREYDNAGQDPLYTVACFSDLHIDYGIQNNDPPIRPSTQVAVEAVKKLGGADVMIVGGDVISGNRQATWNQDLFKKVKSTVYSTLAPATTTGNVLLITGNHDNEPGVYSGDKYYSGYYDDIMLNNTGKFTECFYATELENPLESTKYNELLCYRYSLGGMEIIGINTPYRSERASGYIYAEQITWVSDQMKEIGKDKTVIIFCHYPVSSVASPSGDKGGDANTKLKTLLGLYPNIIYCYGHVHSAPNLTWYNTNESVVPAGAVTQLENGAYETKRYITCHMGSMGYYDYHYQPGGLTEEDPMVVQFLMIDFYADHITFKYYNCGEKAPDADVYGITSFTVMRDMWQLTGGTPSGNADSSDQSDAPDTNGSDLSASTDASAQTPAGGMSAAVLTVLIVCIAVILACAVFVVLYLMKNKKEKK